MNENLEYMQLQQTYIQIVYCGQIVVLLRQIRP